MFYILSYYINLVLIESRKRYGLVLPISESGVVSYILVGVCLTIISALCFKSSLQDTGRECADLLYNGLPPKPVPDPIVQEYHAAVRKYNRYMYYKEITYLAGVTCVTVVFIGGLLVIASLRTS